MHRLVHIIFFFSCGRVTNAFVEKGPPVMTGSMQPLFTGKLGEAIRFICPIRADPQPLFEWYRDGERVMDYWDRYRFSGKGYSLSIQRLECEDQGTYVCKAINGFGAHEISFQLDLLDDSLQEACKSNSEEDEVSSKPAILHKPKNKPKHWLKPAGNYALLKCTAIAAPLPKFHWFKDGVEITTDKGQSVGHGQSPTTPKYVMRATVLSEEDLEGDMEGMRSTLQIGDLRGSDSGNYTCRAKNEHGWDELTQILEVVERQIPRRPEMHPDYPPVHSWVETDQVGSLSCKVLSEFQPDVHWLKRITPSSGASSLLPLLPEEEDVEAAQPQFIANRTLTIGRTQYQILPPAPVKLGADGYYVSILLLSKKSQETDSGYYVCLALNNAGYNYRQVYLNVTAHSTLNHNMVEMTGSTSSIEGLGDRGREEAATTAVVIVVVVCGILAMVASCFVWKRRKSHLKDKTLAAPALLPSSAPESVTVHQTTTSTTPQLPIDYSAFREGLSKSSGDGGSPKALSSSASLPQSTIQQAERHHRVYYLPVRQSSSSPRQHHAHKMQRTRGSSGSNNNNNNISTSSGGRAASTGHRHHHRMTRNNGYPQQQHPSYNNPPSYPPSMAPESRSLTANTSFHSDSFYPDWSAHPVHIRLPYPSPETSFDQV